MLPIIYLIDHAVDTHPDTPGISILEFATPGWPGVVGKRINGIKHAPVIGVWEPCKRLPRTLLNTNGIHRLTGFSHRLTFALNLGDGLIEWQYILAGCFRRIVRGNISRVFLRITEEVTHLDPKCVCHAIEGLDVELRYVSVP
jgi:hypothetical protein